MVTSNCALLLRLATYCTCKSGRSFLATKLVDAMLSNAHSVFRLREQKGIVWEDLEFLLDIKAVHQPKLVGVLNMETLLAVFMCIDDSEDFSYRIVTHKELILIYSHNNYLVMAYLISAHLILPVCPSACVSMEVCHFNLQCPASSFFL